MKTMPHKTTLFIKCMYCQKPMGTKDGDGVSGETSSICPKCYKIHWSPVLDKS